MDRFERGTPAVRTLLAAALWLAAAAVCPPSAGAQPVPNTTAAGKALAQQYCVTCHIVVPSGHGGWTDAPAFDAIANRPGVTAAQLTAFIQKPHMNMLNDQRPKDEADAIATYILSLRKH